MKNRGKNGRAPVSPVAEDAEALRVRDLAPAIALLVIGLMALQIATISTRGVPGQYLVIARPGASLGETLTIVGEARGGLRRVTGFSNMVVASSSAPDFSKKLQASGAWLVLPSPVRSGCFASPSGG